MGRFFLRAGMRCFKPQRRFRSDCIAGDLRKTMRYVKERGLIVYRNQNGRAKFRRDNIPSCAQARCRGGAAACVGLMRFAGTSAATNGTIGRQNESNNNGAVIGVFDKFGIAVGRFCANAGKKRRKATIKVGEKQRETAIEVGERRQKYKKTVKRREEDNAASRPARRSHQVFG